MPEAPSSNAIARVQEYLNEWREIRGTDHEQIHGINDKKLDPLDLETVLAIASSQMENDAVDRFVQIVEAWRARNNLQKLSIDRLVTQHLRIRKIVSQRFSEIDLGQSYKAAIKEIKEVLK